jgi:hypothetical protein
MHSAGLLQQRAGLRQPGCALVMRGLQLAPAMHVAPCYPYREQRADETPAQYVARGLMVLPRGRHGGWPPQ